MMKYIGILLLLSLSSCAFIFKGSEERKLQTKILAKLSEKSFDFRKCAKDTDLYKIKSEKRVRVVLHIDLTPNGSIEKFKLDDNNYPEAFTDCMFKVVELIIFPKFDTHELLKVEQPFIFSQK